MSHITNEKKFSFDIIFFVLDHCSVLRRVYTKVSEKLDAQSVARNMFERNALTLRELESIQSKHNEPIKAAERLLNIVVNQSSNVYGYFLDALKLTDQQHVFEMIVEGSYKGKSSHAVCFVFLNN